jgi:hypothetical protein
VLGRHHMQFVDQGAQARFDALYELLGGMRLVDAEQALAEGRVTDAEAGLPVHWEPAVTVLPVSKRLRERLAAARSKPVASPVFRLSAG